MKSTINRILDEIEQKKKELKVEYEKLREKYNFEYIKWKIKFSEEETKNQRKKKRSFWNMIFSKSTRENFINSFYLRFYYPSCYFRYLNFYLSKYCNQTLWDSFSKKIRLYFLG